MIICKFLDKCNTIYPKTLDACPNCGSLKEECGEPYSLDDFIPVRSLNIQVHVDRAPKMFLVTGQYYLPDGHLAAKVKIDVEKNTSMDEAISKCLKELRKKMNNSNYEYLNE